MTTLSTVLVTASPPVSTPTTAFSQHPQPYFSTKGEQDDSSLPIGIISIFITFGGFVFTILGVWIAWKYRTRSGRHQHSVTQEPARWSTDRSDADYHQSGEHASEIVPLPPVYLPQERIAQLRSGESRRTLDVGVGSYVYSPTRLDKDGYLSRSSERANVSQIGGPMTRDYLGDPPQYAPHYDEHP